MPGPGLQIGRGQGGSRPGKLPWSSALIEEAPLRREKLEGIALRVICAATEQSVQFHGSLKPEVRNGTTIGSNPSELTFGAGSGSLESTAGAGEVRGKWKVMGYAGQELMQVMNP